MKKPETKATRETMVPIGRPRAGKRVITPVGGPSLTKQAFAEETDINKVMAKYQKTGLLPIVQQPLVYGDYSEPVEYQEALNLVLHAEHQFESLPSKIRNRFNNDPSEFLAFCTNEDNKKEMENLGLIEPEKSIPKMEETPKNIEDDKTPK